MFHLAPVGLQRTRAKSSRQSVLKIERDVLTAIGDITDSAYNQKGSFNLTHPDTRALIKALDEFFSHGLVNDGKCYWLFVREYIPAIDHEELRRQWNCLKLRPASLAWLKDSLNKSSLHFQMLAFIPKSAANNQLKVKWYARHACMRNNVMLKRVCMAVERLNLIEFNIESPFVFRTEETPIAVTHDSPLHVAHSLLTPRLGETPLRLELDSSSSPMTIGSDNAGRTQQLSSTVTSGYLVPASLNNGRTGGAIASSPASDELPPNSSYLQSLTSDLPEVKVPSSVHEPTVGNQDFMLEEVLRAHKNRALAELALDANEIEDEALMPSTTSDSHQRPIEIEEEAEGEEVEEEIGERLSDMKITELDAHHSTGDESRSPLEPTMSESMGQQPPSPKAASIPAGKAEESDSALFNNSSAVGDELSDDPAVLDDMCAVEGDEEVDSGTIIQLASEVFKENGEKFHKMFRVFVGHSTGHPQLRHLLITNLYIYLISAESIPDAAGNDEELEFGARVGSWIGIDSFRIGSLTRNDDSFGTGLGRPSSSLLSRTSLLGGVSARSTGVMQQRRISVRYRVHLEMRLSEIDYVTVGVDSQVLCFHLKRRQPATLSSTDGKYERYEKKTYVVEIASYPLGRLITHVVKRVMADYNTMLSVSPESSNDVRSSAIAGGDKQQQQCTLIFTHSTQLSIIMKRFTKKELGLPYVEIIHHSLVYWLERPERGERVESDELEGYLYVRDVGSRSWLAGKRPDEWQHGYFVMRGPMLYQFADSTCKFAVRSLNVKECIECVELTADGGDEKHTFEAVLNEEASIHSISEGSPRAIQFSCPDQTELKRWLTRLSHALSTPSGSPMPAACMLIVTDTNILFAQEGTNCIVDGFMRSLATLWINRISAIYALRTETQNLLVVKREDGMLEWISLRGERELNRLIATFTERWRFPVEDCLEGENFSKPEFSRMFKQCALLPDMWIDPATIGEALQ